MRMPTQIPRAERPALPDIALLARFIVNGLAAAAVHFSVLHFNLTVLAMQSAGAANLLAAVAGLSASFVGSRYFVFRRADAPIVGQAARFGVLYGLIACLHGLVLYLWTDVGHRDYRTGFLLATGMQVVLSFVGNKMIVFRA
jgi:putative flippase GtrA